MIRMSGPVKSAGVLEQIYGGTIHATRIWVMTDAIKITEVLGEPIQRYFLVVLTDLCDEDDKAELARLEAELGNKLDNCIVERDEFEEEHPFFPGSSRYTMLTLYGG